MRALRECLAIAGLLTIFGSIGLYWSQLPERIPTRYGLSGAPDGFGPKATIWILAGAAIFLYALTSFVGSHPERLNLPAWVTPEQRRQVQPQAVATIGWLKAEIIWIFAWMTWTTLQVALGRSSGLGSAFLPTSLGVVVVTVWDLVYDLRSLKDQSGPPL
jgi:Protein of unknown function (DUF1648)